MEIDSLFDLAYESLARCILDLCNKLTECLKKTERKPETVETPETKAAAVWKAELVCEQFHRMLVDALPATLADEISNRLLTHIDCWWYDNMKKKYLGDCKDILQHIVKCVIHPSVSRIGPNFGTIRCLDLFDNRGFNSKMMIPLLQHVLPSLTKLKALNLRCYGTKKLTDIYIPENLEEFIGFPDEKLLKCIVSKCPHIKVLNLCDASGISDNSVKEILKLRELEKLSIEGTRISTKAFARLLLGLSENKNLKALGYDFSHNDDHKKIVSSKLRQLTFSVSVVDDDYDYFDDDDDMSLSDIVSSLDYVYLRTLENLRFLSIEGSLRTFKLILPFVGSRLVYLYVDSLNFFTVDDLKEMFNVCRVLSILRCFHLAYSTYFIDRAALEQFEYPIIEGFSSLRCLKLYCHTRPSVDVGKWKVLEQLLKQCRNLQTLTLDYGYCLCKSPIFLKRLFDLYPNILDNLIEFTCKKKVSSNNCNDNGIIELLVQKCPKLRVIGGFSSYSKNCLPNVHRIKFLK